MSLSKLPYKGARDFYPADFRLRRHLFDAWKRVAESFGYEPYDAPLIEPLDLYRGKTGEEIVNEQVYSFTDRGKREVAIRPEMTPSLARMVAAKRQDLAYPLRLYSIPNVWRYERPQRGRLREHWQLNVDIFGVDSLLAEVELIQLAAKLMHELGAGKDMYTVKLNSRKLMNVLLTDYFELSADEEKRVARLIDKMSKIDETDFEKSLADLVGERFDELHGLLHANQLDALPVKVRKYAGDLEDLLAQLAEIGVEAEFDITLVRGFDYYTDVVFEVFDTHPDNRRSLFGGGRYDGLVGAFDVSDVSAAGFGVGEVTMLDFLSTHGLLPKVTAETDLYIAVAGEVQPEALKLAETLRSHGLNVAVDLSARKLDAQIKAAAKKGIAHVLFVGAEEIESGRYKLKNLTTGKQGSVTLKNITARLT